MLTSCCGWRYGKGRSNNALVTEKMAVLAPMASARVKTATRVKPGLRRSMRRPKRRSRRSVCMQGLSNSEYAISQERRQKCDQIKVSEKRARGEWKTSVRRPGGERLASGWRVAGEWLVIEIQRWLASPAATLRSNS